MSESTETLERLWEQIPAGPAPVATVVARARTARRRRRFLVASGVGGVVALALAAAFVVNLSDRGSHDSTFVADDGSQMPAAAMTAVPTEVKPGQLVSVSYGIAVTRGTGYSLTSDEDGSQYTLISDIGGGIPSWSRGRDPIPAIGFGGPGPDHVVIPDVAKPGPHQLCASGEADSGETALCVQLLVS